MVYLIRVFGVYSVVLLFCTVFLRVQLYFDEPAGQVKIQTKKKYTAAILHTKTRTINIESGFIIQLKLL